VAIVLLSSDVFFCKPFRILSNPVDSSKQFKTKEFFKQPMTHQLLWGRYDALHNDTQRNDSWQSDTLHGETNHDSA
jgi:hypothetical protein